MDEGIAAIRRRIDQLARAPRRAQWVAWLWQNAGRHAEALALLDRAGGGRLRLRSLFALDLHRSFLDALGGHAPRGWLVAARGLARLAIGEVDLARDDLAAATAGDPGFGLWLRATSALALIDPTLARRLLEPRGGAPPAAMVLAHLAERDGEPDLAERYCPRLRGRRAAEIDLLAANIARLRGDGPIAEEHAGRAFARYGLGGGLERRDCDAERALVSIVVAAYNAESTIEAAVASLARQSWRRIEIIVVDDASSDATPERVAAMAERDGRIRLLRQPLNQGAYVARNAGVAAARGGFIAFHDADDVAHPERIERQTEPMLADASLGFTLARWVRRTTAGAFRDRQLAPLIRLHVGSFVVRADLQAAVGPFDPVRFGADGEMLLRLQLAAGPRGYRALRLPLTVGGWDHRSAVHDSETGYGERGYSRPRQAYREASTWRLVKRLQAPDAEG